MEPTISSSDGLRLRATTTADAARIQALCEQPSVRRWTSIPSPFTKAMAIRFATNPPSARLRVNDRLKWAVVSGGYGHADDPDSGTHTGIVQCSTQFRHDTGGEHHRCALGFGVMEAFDITAEGLLLTPPTVHDAERVYELCQDPQIARWTAVPSPYTRAHAESFCAQTVQEWRMGLSLTWGIRDPTAGLMGMITLISRGDGNWEIGYWMGSSFRGKGLMVTAVNAVLDAAFDAAGPIGAARVQWRCDFDGDVPNWASWRVAWHTGFHKQGRTRASQLSKGTRRDNWLADVLPDDPRTPATPWDGPVAHGDRSLYEQVTVPTDATATREGDSPEGFVARFHRLYGRPIATDGPSLNRDSLGLRMSLISEEFGELFEAVYGTTARNVVDKATAVAMDNDEEHRDVIGTADALADLVYVIYGMALEMGIDLPAVLAEVQRSNMSKMGADHHPILRDDGKVLKGPDYFPPDVAAVLQRSARDRDELASRDRDES